MDEKSIITKLHELIEATCITEEMPKEWNGTSICPIYKRGDKLNCTNYRSVSLLKVKYKIITAIISDRIELYVDAGKVYANYPKDHQ